MPSPRVFVSSTAYDLRAVRERLRGLIEDLGFDPVLSEYGDLLYDPSHHTQENCTDEVATCDLVVLIIGGRYGSAGDPLLLESTDLDGLEDSDLSNVSITQLETLHALGHNVPVFALVDHAVFSDLRVYEENLDGVAANIVYPSIETQQSAPYIFEFIRFLQGRPSNNAIVSFSSFAEIEDYLKKQWAALFQRLLSERADERRSTEIVISLREELQDLKAAVLTTIEPGQARLIANGVLRYRRLVDFLTQFGVDPRDYVGSSIPWEELLHGVIGVVEILADEYSGSRNETLLVMGEGGFAGVRVPYLRFGDFGADWRDFEQLDATSADAIVDAVRDQRTMPVVRRYTEEEFVDRMARQRAGYVGSDAEGS